MKKFWQKAKDILCDGFLFILIYELFEEALEDLLAYLLSSVVSSILSKVFCIGITQGVKYIIKNAIKVITYREGADKMMILKKILYGTSYNICSIVMILLSGFGAFSAYMIIPVDLWLKIVIGLGILTIGILCTIKIGFKKFETIMKEREENKIKRENKRLEKEAKRENKLKEKEIKKIAEQLEKDKIEQFKLEEEKRLADLKVNIMNEAQLKYAEELKNKEIENAKLQEVKVEENVQENIEVKVEEQPEIKNEGVVEQPETLIRPAEQVVNQ